MIEYIGLLFEIVFLLIGVYVYLFFIGKVQAKDPKARAKGEAFRQKNGWMRYAALALVAIMLVNVYLHITQLFS